MGEERFGKKGVITDFKLERMKGKKNRKQSVCLFNTC